MLPLVSKTRPIEMGASSLEKALISCSTLSSKSLKWSFSSPVTKRLRGSVTVTLIKTNVLLTRISTDLESTGVLAFVDSRVLIFTSSSLPLEADEYRPIFAFSPGNARAEAARRRQAEAAEYERNDLARDRTPGQKMRDKICVRM